MSESKKADQIKYDIEREAAAIIERTILTKQAKDTAITIQDANKLYLMRFDRWYEFVKQRAAGRDVQFTDCGAVVFTNLCVNTTEWDSSNFSDYVFNLQHEILTDREVDTRKIELPILHH